MTRPAPRPSPPISARRRAPALLAVTALVVALLAVGVTAMPPATASTAKGVTIPPATTCKDGSVAPTGGLQPRQIAAAYGIDKLWDLGYQGQGQHVALIEPGERLDKDKFAPFNACWGPFDQVHETVIGGGTPAELGGEPNFDSEVLLAVAPKVARVDLFESATDDNAMYPALFAAALDPANTGGKLVDAISISFKNCEQSWTKTDIDNTNAVLAKAVALGVKVFAAGGDSGSVGAYPNGGSLPACVSHPVTQPPPAQVELAVIFPAGSPLVTAVGGTELAIDGKIPPAGSKDGGPVTDEVVWSSTGPAGTFAGGGGQSSVFPISQAPWQEAFGLTGMVHRPDVSALAGAPRYLNGGIGTSGASPMTAGGMVVLDGYLEAKGVKPPTFLNPVLYDLARTDYARVFYDVTDGNNDVYKLGCCTAGRGYDMASGLGTIRFDGLAAVLLERAQRPTTTTTTPSTTTSTPVIAPVAVPVATPGTFTG